LTGWKGWLKWAPSKDVLCNTTNWPNYCKLYLKNDFHFQTKSKLRTNKMRNLIYAINLTADGCCEHTKVGGSEEILEYYTNFFKDIGLIVYGRKTYELMIPYWPDVINDPTSVKAEVDFAKAFGAIDKVVVSRTLDSVEENARIVRENLGDEIRKLKEQPGKNISVGGVDLPSQLVELGLIDEFYFVVHPFIAGEGRRLFDHAKLPERLSLKLVDTRTFKSGAVALHYLKQ
jgi:dihydrofolate reductase